MFEPVVGVVHDVGVEAHSDDHQERLAPGEGPRVRPHVGDLRKFTLRRLRGADSADVDPLKPSGQGHHGEVAKRGAERQVEVASQQISRSERKNAQRNVGSGELPGDGAHRPVPARGDHHGGPLRQGRAGLTRSRIVGGRAVPAGRGVSGVGRGLFDHRLEVPHVPDLRGVDDDGHRSLARPLGFLRQDPRRRRVGVHESAPQGAD